MSQDSGGASLTLVVSAFYAGAVGFGDIFDCQIRRVSAGITPDSTIQLSILPSDQAWLNMLLAHLAPAEVEIGFVAHQHGEPYEVMPISGFVDSTRTSWKIVFIHETHG